MYVGILNAANLHFCVGDLDLAEKIKRYTSGRVEVEEGAMNCPCIDAECRRTEMFELKNEVRNVFAEEMRTQDGCNIEKLGISDSSEKISLS